MTVKRLRPLPTAEQLAAMYATPHDHRIYGRGHGERVDGTIALALAHVPEASRTTVADLSCGNGAIAEALVVPWGRTYLGDFAPGYEFRGPLEDTLLELPTVETYVCSETLEHLDDPQMTLLRLRAKASWLVLSTPIGCWDDANGEHLWAWDREGVEGLLSGAGWQVVAFDHVDSTAYGEPYDYGLWVAS